MAILGTSTMTVVDDPERKGAPLLETEAPKGASDNGNDPIETPFAPAAPVMPQRVTVIAPSTLQVGVVFDGVRCI